MNKFLNLLFLCIFILGTFSVMPGAHAFDLDCDTSDFQTDYTVHEKIHDCHHCCHHAHAINTFKEEFELLTMSQTVSAYQHENLSHLYYPIKRPPRFV